MQDPIKILGVPVHAMTMQEAVKTLEERMLAKEQTFVVTANAEIIMMCQENAEYKKIICEDAELVLPDGAGAVWAGRHLGYKVPERVAGFDLYNELLDLSAHKGYKAYFFGGSPGIAEAAKAKAEELYPGVQVVGCHNGAGAAAGAGAAFGAGAAARIGAGALTCAPLSSGLYSSTLSISTSYFFPFNVATYFISFNTSFPFFACS